jgi:hypothetical protein
MSAGASEAERHSRRPERRPGAVRGRPVLACASRVQRRFHADDNNAPGRLRRSPPWRGILLLLGLSVTPVTRVATHCRAYAIVAAPVPGRGDAPSSSCLVLAQEPGRVSRPGGGGSLAHSGHTSRSLSYAMPCIAQRSIRTSAPLAGWAGSGPVTGVCAGMDRAPSVNCDATVRRPTLAHPPASSSAPGPRRNLGAGGSSAPAPRRMCGWVAATCTCRGSRRTRDPAGSTPSPQAPAVAAVPERRKAPYSSRPRSGAATAAAKGFRQPDDSSCSSLLAARVVAGSRLSSAEASTCCIRTPRRLRGSVEQGTCHTTADA